MNYYEVRDRTTGELLASGTARECKRLLGCSSLDSFYALANRSIRGTNKKYDVIRMKGGEAVLKGFNAEATNLSQSGT